MTLYGVIDLKNKKMMYITDVKALADSAKNSGEYIVLSTDEIHLSSAARSEISMAYDADCVEESVCTALREKGIDEDVDYAAFTKLASAIAADAYHNMLKYDQSEDYAIETAMKECEEEISRLLTLSEAEEG